MRPAPAFVLLLALGIFGCGSDDAAPADTGPNLCVSNRGECAVNFPFVCRPGKEATTGELALACGTEASSGKQIPCCFPVAEVDTGVDSGADTSDAGAPADGSAGDVSGEAAVDALADAVKEASSGDAAGDGG